MKAMAAAQMIVRLDPKDEDILDRLEELFFLRKAVSEDQLREYHESIKSMEALEGEPHGAAEALLGEKEEAAEANEVAGVDVVAALKQVPLFARLSVSELKGLQTYSLLSQFAPNEPVISGGNVRRSLFVILQGSVKILGKDKDQRDTFFATLDAGTLLGEFGLFGRIDTTISVIAEQPSVVLEIPRDIVMRLAKTRPYIIEMLKDLFRRRILDNALARVPLFSQLAPRDRRKIVTHFKPVKAKQKATLVREGDPGDSMYFIVAGEVGVYTSLADADEDEGGNAAQEQLLLAKLKSGDFFGEQALVTDEPRSATVTALSNVVMLKFTKADLNAILEEYPSIESELQIEAFRKLMRKRLSILKEMMPGAKT
jgi:CRP-like cAMP-binding protein